MWSGRRLTIIQATARSENLWPEVWSKMGKAAQKNERQEWANEKPKFKCSMAFFFTDPEDSEHKGSDQKRKEKVGSSSGCGNALQKKEQRSTLGFRKLTQRVITPTRFQRQGMRGGS